MPFFTAAGYGAPEEVRSRMIMAVNGSLRKRMPSRLRIARLDRLVECRGLLMDSGMRAKFQRKSLLERDLDSETLYQRTL